jgi:ADP-ribosylglycohydrolase
MDTDDPVRRSMLWSAYGDAMGFITELASRSMVRRRIGGDLVTHLVRWTRRVGGRFGIEVELPAGCYSDDTQLRLATCRSIRGDGTFDVEVFAKVELPVWRAYSLGAGTGTKLAAQGLVRPGVQWYTNFYQTSYAQYINGGGNGGVMRVQPHVWAAPPAASFRQIGQDIVRNTIITHGHPRAIVGACFHGLCLLHALRHGTVAAPRDWKTFEGELALIGDIVHEDNDLNTFWLPNWERESGQAIERAVRRTLDELAEHVKAADDALRKVGSTSDLSQVYAELAGLLGSYARDQRGSATKTAVLAAFLSVACWQDPPGLVRTCVNLLDTDTDSIASMAGALIGCVCGQDPPEPVLDLEYLEQQACRLSSIAKGNSSDTFEYPDLLYWKPPEAEVDYVGRHSGEWAVAGLGRATPIAPSYEKQSPDGFRWQWFRLAFGPQMLFKVRSKPGEMPSNLLPMTRPKGATDVTSNTESQRPRPAEHTQEAEDKWPGKVSVDEATDAAIRSNFDPRVVGSYLMRLAEGESGIEHAIGYAAIIAKAKQARMKRDRRR